MLPYSRVIKIFSYELFQKLYCFSFTFRSMIHLEFFCVCIKIYMSINIFSSRYVIDSMPFNLKEHSFPIVLHCHLYHKSSYHICVGQFLDSLFCSPSLFVTISHCISWPSFKRVSISGQESPPTIKTYKRPWNVQR